MYETHLTAIGRVASPVEKRQFADGGVKASFRVACNERRRDRNTGNWVDGDSLYLSVTCWRLLAENVHASLVVGDPVIVRGRLHTRQYEKDGRRSSIIELEASAVGPDLKWSTATVTRAQSASGPPVAAPPCADGAATTGSELRGEQPQDLWRPGPLIDHRDGRPGADQVPVHGAGADGVQGRREAARAGVGA